MTRLKTIIGMLAVSFALSGAASATIITDDPSLPPTVGSYRTASDVHAEYAGPGLALATISHFGFINVFRIIVFPNEFEQFDSTVTGFAGPIEGRKGPGSNGTYLRPGI